MAPARANSHSLRAPALSLPLVFALTVAASSGLVGDTQAAPPEDAAAPSTSPEVLHMRTALELEVPEDEAQALESRCSSELRDLFLNRSVLPGEADDPEIRVEVEAYEDLDNPGYRARAVVIEKGAPVEGSAREIECELCTHGELAGKLRVEVELILEFWRSRSPEPAATGPSGEEGPPAPTGADPATGRDGGRRGLGPLGYAGVGVGAVGLVGIGVGAALVPRGVEAQGPDFLDAKDHRKPGLAAIGVGVGALVTGVVLIVVDRVNAKKQKGAEARRGFDPVLRF